MHIMPCLRYFSVLFELKMQIHIINVHAYLVCGLDSLGFDVHFLRPLQALDSKSPLLAKTTKIFLCVICFLCFFYLTINFHLAQNRSDIWSVNKPFTADMQFCQKLHNWSLEKINIGAVNTHLTDSIGFPNCAFSTVYRTFSQKCWGSSRWAWENKRHALLYLIQCLKWGSTHRYAVPALLHLSVPALKKRKSISVREIGNDLTLHKLHYPEGTTWLSLLQILTNHVKASSRPILSEVRFSTDASWKKLSDVCGFCLTVTDFSLLKF